LAAKGTKHGLGDSGLPQDRGDTCVSGTRAAEGKQQGNNFDLLYGTSECRAETSMS